MSNLIKLEISNTNSRNVLLRFKKTMRPIIVCLKKTNAYRFLRKFSDPVRSFLVFVRNIFRSFLVFVRKIYCWHIPYKKMTSVAECINQENPDYMMIENVQLIGNSRLMVHEDVCVIDSGIPERKSKDILRSYYLHDEKRGLIQYQPQTHQVKFIKKPFQHRDVILESAVTLLHQGTGNYMHWVSEMLPRIARSVEKKLDVIYVIDRDVPPQVMESLKALSPEASVCVIGPWQMVKVCKLFFLNLSGGYYSWLRKNETQTQLPIYAWDREGLLLVRKSVLSSLNITPKKERKIFVRRKSSLRKLHNQNQLEDLLVSEGFEIVDPQKLSFSEQVKVFSESALVVIQAGAACANMMFMPRDSRTICLAVDSPYVHYDYFLDYAGMFGIKLSYILGTVDNPKGYCANKPITELHPTNAGFSVKPERLFEEILAA